MTLIPATASTTGVAGAAGLALSPDGSTLYVADLGSRCIWTVDADARELTAGGRGCTAAFAGLPGYPGALAADTDGTLYISYRWARSNWPKRRSARSPASWPRVSLTCLKWSRSQVSRASG